MVTQADVILLFSDGQLREMGNHTQLLAQGGLYQRLWQHYQQAQHWGAGWRHRKRWWKIKDDNPADNTGHGASTGASYLQRWQSGRMLRRSMLALLLAALHAGDRLCLSLSDH